MVKKIIVANDNAYNEHRIGPWLDSQRRQLVFNKKLGTNIKRCERVADEQESIFWDKITVVELVTNFELY